ncbi:MAG: tryptophan-rich sensory protein [Saprospiraceae bacterium]|nr:tryptophan-rich sensory protein [Saprospiraceae bacterium]
MIPLFFAAGTQFLWTFLFFGYHRADLALAEMLLMWMLILLTIVQFARVDKPAAWMLVPYISWVSFASILTYYIMV